MIVVTGATGQAGSEVARALAARGDRVRAFVRDPGKARRMLGENVDLAIGDLADPRSVRAALDGADALFLSCADDPRRVGWERSAIGAAVAAGVRRVVKLSAVGAEPGSPVAFWDWHGQVEQHLRASGTGWVILRSSWYMSNLLAAAAQVLSSPGHERQSYLVTGPEAITFAQVSAGLSAAMGSRIEFTDIPGEDARQAMVGGGMPEFAAEQVIKIFEQLRQGADRQVTATVEVLTGSAPRDFASFARDHARL